MALNYHQSMPQQNISRPHYPSKKENSQAKPLTNPMVASPQDHAMHSITSVNRPPPQNAASTTHTAGLSAEDSGSLSANSHNNSQNTRNSTGSSFNQRQQGTVEKLLHSYGFINSEVQKEGHLFFHYSEVVGDANALALGDCVEFNLSYDYRSSRWLAVSVTKVESALTVSKEKFFGLVLKKAEPQEKFKVKNSLDRSGRISYEQSGECFYIPYSTLDLEDEQNPPLDNDKVTFFIATDKKTGHMWATCVKKIAPLQKSQGVVCSLKENFGFIERADMVKEIFFHYSEFSGNIAELVLGDDVEFNIQTRNGKEVATSITKLPEGTVVFEDVSTDKKRGKIAKVIKATRKHAEPLAGSIVYETLDGSKNIPYSERDISGEFTLFVGDIVDFQIAKDRRDGLLHATGISLCEESFIVSKEKRDRGVVSSVKESYGFLQILNPDCSTGLGDAQLFFHFNELYELTSPPVVVGDEIEFTVAYDPGNKSKPIAIRIRKLPKGSIKQEQTISSQTYNGTVVQDQPVKAKKVPGANLPNNPTDTGLIKYTANNKDVTIPYLVKEADLRYGDKVSFNICDLNRSADSKRAVNIKLLSRLGLQYGFICSLRESYGFMETIALDDEIFFHYSCYQGDANDLDIGDVVEYSLVCRNKKVSAENVRKNPQKKITMDINTKIYSGKITRGLRNSSTADRDTYSGLVQVEDSNTFYPFGMISLSNKRSAPAIGTQVEFQVALINGSISRAVNIVNVKDIVFGSVDTIKGSFGFIEVEDREKKVYFNMGDIQDGSSLAVGDSVQCVVVPVIGTNKISAVCIRKLERQSTRPDRLISKLKTQMSMTEGPRLVITRQPYRPDGKSKGFAPRTQNSGFSKGEARA